MGEKVGEGGGRSTNESPPPKKEKIPPTFMSNSPPPSQKAHTLKQGITEELSLAKKEHRVDTADGLPRLRCDPDGWW